MNIQTAATLSGHLVAVGGIPIPGARHHAYAFPASGLATQRTDISTAADLGSVGVEGIEIVPLKRIPGGQLTTSQAEFNTAFSKIRAAVEHAITPPQDMAHAQRGRRTISGTDRKIPKHAQGRYRTLLLRGL